MYITNQEDIHSLVYQILDLLEDGYKVKVSVSSKATYYVSDPEDFDTIGRISTYLEGLVNSKKFYWVSLTPMEGASVTS